MTMTYCCAMRARFVLGIVAENPAYPTPSSVIDYMDWDAKLEDGTAVLRIAFCPFCGVRIGEHGKLRVAQ